MCKITDDSVYHLKKPKHHKWDTHFSLRTTAIGHIQSINKAQQVVVKTGQNTKTFNYALKYPQGQLASAWPRILQHKNKYKGLNVVLAFYFLIVNQW